VYKNFMKPTDFLPW